jgi:hypothetical protein
MTKILVTPVSLWSPTGTKTAKILEVRYVNYSAPTAVADCHLFTEDGVEVQGSVIAATAEQCAAWTDDAAFAAVLATNAGLTPVDPVTEWTPPAPEPA